MRIREGNHINRRNIFNLGNLIKENIKRLEKDEEMLKKIEEKIDSKHLKQLMESKVKE